MAAAVVATEAVVVAALVVAVAMALHVRAYLYLVLNLLQVPFQCKKSLYVTLAVAVATALHVSEPEDSLHSLTSACSQTSRTRHVPCCKWLLAFHCKTLHLYRIGLAEVATVLLLAMVLIVGASQCPHVCC